MTKNTHYAVFKGRRPGIYDSWRVTRKQVHKFSGAKYRGYGSLAEAKKAYGRHMTSIREKTPQRASAKALAKRMAFKEYLYSREKVFQSIMKLKYGVDYKIPDYMTGE